jgi:actin-like ATPase involved in cell morphogenesis
MGNDRFKPPLGQQAQLRASLSKSVRKLNKPKCLFCPPKRSPPSSANPPSQLDSERLQVVTLQVVHNRSQRILAELKQVNPLKVRKKPLADDQRNGASLAPPPPASIIAVDHPDEVEVYSLGDVFEGVRVPVNHLGIDIGTKTIVVAYKGANGKTAFISEINGYWPFERATPFVENMLNDPNKVRSDGTKRPARWIKLDDRIVVLGKDAEEFAYAKNDTLLRPMAEGGIAPDEEAMTVLSSLIHGLINMAEKDVGQFGEELKLCYCTTAPAINKDVNVEYHQRVVNIILDGYETTTKKTVNVIKESHAIVLNMSPDGTGIGISWGAGTVTVSYIKYGMEIYSFCWVGAGDWIDTQVAMRHGYNPDLPKTMKSKAKETPTTVSRRKMEVDLTPGKEPADRLGLDVCLHYDVLMSQVLEGIVSGFRDNENQARIDEGINIYVAGGTSSPKGFIQRMKAKLEEKELPFTVNDVKRADKPLVCVAEGCLKAAEMF